MKKELEFKELELLDVLEEMGVDVKEHLMDYVRGNISQEKIDAAILAAYERGIPIELDNSETTRKDDGTISIEFDLQGATYDPVIDNLYMFDNLIDVVENVDKINFVYEATKLLNNEFGVELYEILDEFDKYNINYFDVVEKIIKEYYPNLSLDIEIYDYQKNGDCWSVVIDIKAKRDFSFSIFDQGKTVNVEINELFDKWDWIAEQLDDENEKLEREDDLKIIKSEIKDLFELSNSDFESSEKIVDYINDRCNIDYYKLIITRH